MFKLVTRKYLYSHSQAIDIHSDKPMVDDSPPKERILFEREKILLPGDVINVKGTVNRDFVEGRGSRYRTSVSIRVIGQQNLGITWNDPYLSLRGIPHLGEEIVVFGDTLKMGFSELSLFGHRTVDLTGLPSVFTWRDLWNEFTVMPAQIAAIKDEFRMRTETKTTLIYECGLPPQARR